VQIDQQLINRWADKMNEFVDKAYEQEPDRKPKEYGSNREAYEAIIEQRELKLRELVVTTHKNITKLNIGDTAKVIIDTVAITFVPSKDGYSLAVYDYDKCMYTFNTNTILNDYIVYCMGASSQSIINSVVTTLTGMRFKGAIYHPLPNYKIAVGNGIYNCLTKKLEAFTPYYTVLTKISTNYIENPIKPRYKDGFTLESMIATLSDGKPDRIALICQICKAILTGHSLKPGLFIILGSGGDGKSTFFTMIANIIGDENVAYLNFSELDSPDKMAETINKKLVLGLDNDVKIYLRKTALLKSIASHETITHSRKYMNAISVPFTGTFVQLCNEMPRMAESGSSMKRRLVSFKAENSHYENGTENDNVDTVYIKDKKFLEYALWYFLNEETCPYYSDFNDTDRRLVSESLDAEDVLSQFLNEMQQIGVLASTNKYLPSSHLFAAYQDWMEINNPGSKTLSARGFAIQVANKLTDYGYETSTQQNTRPASLEKNNLYSTLSWGEYKNRSMLSRAIEMNSPSKLFVKVRDVKPPTEIRRKSKIISAIEYFNIEAKISSDLNEELLPNEFEKDETLTINELINQQEKNKEQEENKKIYQLKSKPPIHDLRSDLENKNMENINEQINYYKDVIKEVNNTEDENLIMEASNVGDYLLDLLYQIVVKFKDQMLLVRLKSDILDEDEFATAKIEFGLEIIDQLIERHFE